MRRLGIVSIPRVCTLCGRYTQTPLDCCADCESSLPMIEVGCERCGASMDTPTRLCNRCLLAMPAYDRTWPGFHHRGAIQKQLARFKHQADLTTGRFLSDVYARRLVEMKTPRPDLLVPMPMHRMRYWIRGFDQTALICQDLSRHFQGLPWTRALRLNRRTKPQHKLRQEARWANVRGAFSVARIPKGTHHIGLVDDVMETGASVHEAALALKKAGAGRVDVWVVARG